MFKNKVYIQPDKYAGYEVVIKYWFWPWPLQYGGINTWRTVEQARRWATFREVVKYE